MYNTQLNNRVQYTVEETLPWTLIPSVSPAHPEDICFITEGFCGLLAETPIAADSVPEFIAIR